MGDAEGVHHLSADSDPASFQTAEQGLMTGMRRLCAAFNTSFDESAVRLALSTCERDAEAQIASALTAAVVPHARQTLKIWLRATTRFCLASLGGQITLVERLPEGFMVGSRQLSADALAALDGEACVFAVEAPALDDGRGSEMHPGAKRNRWFLQALWRLRGDYADVILASLLINSLALAMPLYVMNVYDRVVPNTAVATLWALALGVCIAVGFDFLFRLMRFQLLDWAGRNLDVDVSNRLFRQVTGVKLKAKPRSGAVAAQQFLEFDHLRDYFTGITLAAVTDLPFLLIYAGVMALISGPLALIPVAAGASIFVVVALINRPLFNVSMQAQQLGAQKNAVAVEAMYNLETIKASSGENALRTRWHRLVDEAARLGNRRQNLTSLVNSYAYLAGLLASVLVILAGTYRVFAGELSLGGLIAASILTGRIIAPLGALAGLTARWSRTRIALTGLNTLMDLDSEAANPEGIQTRVQGRFRLDGVSFAYADAAPPAVAGLNLSIAAGEIVAVLGPMGSGKTTLLRLLSGMYSPDQGSAYLDDCKMSQYDPHALRSQIGFLPQHPGFLNGTVGLNLSMGRVAEEGEIREALELACCAGWLNETSEGLRTPVAERGENFSGGQRHTLAVARAVLGNPQIVLLDEPTAPLDGTVEKRLIANFKAWLPGRTAVIATHRLPVLELATRVIVMDQGKVVMDGEPKEVLARLSGQAHG